MPAARSSFAYAFEGRITSHDVGPYRYSVVYLPQDLAEQLPFERGARLRIKGVIGSALFSGAWQPARGRWFLIVGKRLLRQSGYRLGDLAMVRFGLDDPESVAIPEALQVALAGAADVRTAWDQLSAGKRRALAHHVDSAKTEPTRAKRVAATLELLRSEDPGKLWALKRAQSGKTAH
jgi:hypothetical protein